MQKKLSNDQDNFCGAANEPDASFKRKPGVSALNGKGRWDDTVWNACPLSPQQASSSDSDTV